VKKAILPRTFKNWPDEDFKSWMDSNLCYQLPEFRSKHWRRYKACWQKIVPKEDVTVLEKFLLQWIKPERANQRALCLWGREQNKIRQTVLEPLAMALCPPEDPWLPMWTNCKESPSQAAIDRRLAEWLRGVILTKDVSMLQSLVTALGKIECDLHVGIHVDEITQSLALDDSDHWSQVGIMEAFYGYIEANKKLPHKRHVTKHINDTAARSRYLKGLGLNGLPKAPQSAPELVVRKPR
jgi:hypothetical protein